MPKKDEIWSIISITLLLLLLSSCVHRQKYPLEWPPLISAENQKCPDISGIFLNIGEKSDDTIIYLSDVFGKTAMSKRITPAKRNENVVTHVQIIQQDDALLDIAFWNNDTLVDRGIYSKKKGEYHCTPEGVRISLGSEMSFRMGEGITPVSVNWLTLCLTKNTNCELVVRYTSSGMGLAFIVPIAGSASNYVRFRQK